MNPKILLSAKCCDRQKPRGSGSKEEEPDPAWKQSRDRRRKECSTKSFQKKVCQLSEKEN